MLILIDLQKYIGGVPILELRLEDYWLWLRGNCRSSYWYTISYYLQSQRFFISPDFLKLELVMIQPLFSCSKVDIIGILMNAHAVSDDPATCPDLYMGSVDVC